MQKTERYRQEVQTAGFTIIEDVVSNDDIHSILQIISQAGTSTPAFRKGNELFAIRQFLKEVPAAIPFVFSDTLKMLIRSIFGEDYFLIKSIYFDKPEGSNWFVSYHQDLTISVNKKADLAGFNSWTVKQGQFGVQPPVFILENNFTIRIHLDDANENNGALRVVPGSHLKGIHRPEIFNPDCEKEIVCGVNKGGIMVMKPLLMHASGRSTNNSKRRVIHIEFSNACLPEPLSWAEQKRIFN